MANDHIEDKLEGDFGRRRVLPPRGPLLPGISVAGGSKRARTAWFSRPRGAGTVRLKTPRAAFSQRVIVKARVVVHAAVAAKGGSAGALMRHALYVERDGADRDGGAVKVFDREVDEAQGAAFVERCVDDRHHFRIIVSPEYGGDLQCLKTYTRDLMDRVETDLKTQIDWIAAEHHDTGRPHVHLLMRGVRDDGRDLVIPRDYISHTFRHRAEEIATRELGPRLETTLSHELDRRSERAATLERPTHLEGILQDHARAHVVRIGDLPAAPHLRGPLVQRLNRLADWGLANRESPDRWRLALGLEDRLLRLRDTRERAHAALRLLAREDRGLEPARMRALEDAHSSHRVVGRLVGLQPIRDDGRGPQLIGVEGVDGRFWTARIAQLEDLRELNGLTPGAIVAVHCRAPALKRSDRTILEVAHETSTYSAALHRALVPSDRSIYIQMHERRLEALSRKGVVRRTADGVFHLPQDYADQVLALEGKDSRLSAAVELLDPHPLAAQIDYRGPTWLDQLAFDAAGKNQLGAVAFGKEAADAWPRRVDTLEALGLGQRIDGAFSPTPGFKRALREMERTDFLTRIERETGAIAYIARHGDLVEGVFERRIRVAERTYALIAQEGVIALAPWRPAMDRALNQLVSGRVNGRNFDFRYGRKLERSAAKSLMRGLGLER